MNTINFEIIYQKSSEMLADYLSKNVVNSIQIEDGQMEKTHDLEDWISDIKKWMLNGTQVNNANVKKYLNYYWANRFFIEDNLLLVRIQYRGEPYGVWYLGKQILGTSCNHVCMINCFQQSDFTNGVLKDSNIGKVILFVAYWSLKFLVPYWNWKLPMAYWNLKLTIAYLQIRN